MTNITTINGHIEAVCLCRYLRLLFAYQILLEPTELPESTDEFTHVFVVGNPSGTDIQAMQNFAAAFMEGFYAARPNAVNTFLDDKILKGET